MLGSKGILPPMPGYMSDRFYKQACNALYHISWRTAELLHLFSVAVRIHGLPSPAVRAHLVNASFCRPAQLVLRFRGVRVACGDISRPSRLDHIRDIAAHCFGKCLDHFQNAVAPSCSQVIDVYVRFIFKFLQSLYMADSQVSSFTIWSPR